MTTVTESWVDAKDDAVRGGLQTEIAKAVANLSRDMLRMTRDLRHRIGHSRCCLCNGCSNPGSTPVRRPAPRLVESTWDRPVELLSSV